LFYCLRFETSLFFASYDLQGYGGGIRPRLHSGLLTYVYLSESDLLYDWQFIANQFVLAPSSLRLTARFFSQLNTWGHSPLYNILSEERMGLLFTIAAGPCQRIYSRVRVPWDSRPYFTVSDSGLPFLSSPTIRRATVEVFDPASTQQTFGVLLFSASPPIVSPPYRGGGVWVLLRHRELCRR
jgi:hypothetical protein